MKNFVLGLATLLLAASAGEAETWAQRRAARQTARQQARYATGGGCSGTQASYGCGGGTQMMYSTGCNGGGAQMVYTGGGCCGGSAAQMVYTGGGCCGGGGVQYVPAPQPVQYTKQVYNIPAQPVQTAAPPAEGVRLNVQYVLPAPQVEGGNMQIPAPTQQQQCAPPVQDCPACPPSQKYKQYSTKPNYITISATRRQS